MTKPLFDVAVSSVKKIHDMPDTWSDTDHRQLLQQLEVESVDDVCGNDLVELTQMALQDLEPDDAADAVLAYKLGDTITPGARQNIVQDFLQGQRPWEETADISLHSRIFAAAVLLHRNFTASFMRPDMMRVVLRVSALTPGGKAVFSSPPTAAFVTRMLADAMDTHSILERLFDEQLVAHSFPEAEGIIWRAEFSTTEPADERSAILTIYSSGHWLKTMESVSEFQSSAYNDSDPGEVDHG